MLLFSVVLLCYDVAAATGIGIQNISIGSSTYACILVIIIIIVYGLESTRFLYTISEVICHRCIRVRCYARCAYSIIRAGMRETCTLGGLLAVARCTRCFVGLHMSLRVTSDRSDPGPGCLVEYKYLHSIQSIKPYRSKKKKNRKKTRHWSFIFVNHQTLHV